MKGQLFVCCLLVVALFSRPGEALCLCPTCPNGWRLMDGYCYRVFPQDKQWSKADEFCNKFNRSRSSSLVSIHSEKENKFVGNLAGKRRSWIGLHDRYSEAKFMYTDGSPFNYDAFLPGEPNNANGEDCVEIKWRKWNDLKCNLPRPFICKMWPSYEEK
ncbi:C-type lectin lectoxin-Lio2-like [Acanthaster planci]|uniref:C-type lectin lectoxin-Lio2-like n=1 Tax=Acanthaster planci TaxID=133434 RepID=A0A8B7ZXF3_ACAPL|nr:C-type lectin lectoxin-Lio2-like [Acanthaster planci]